MILRDSWFPLRRINLSGNFNLYKNKRVIVSTEWYPRSTKSPIIIYRLAWKLPPFWNNSNKSKNCPWTSPQTVTGACTGWTLDSSNSSALTFLQSFFIVFSGKILQARTVYIHWSTFMTYLYLIIYIIFYQ